MAKTIDDKKLAAWVDAIKNVGPDRVVINTHGDATTPRIAKESHSILPVIIYVRGDGWSLGTPAMFDTVAQRLWDKEWVAVIYKDMPSNEWHWKRWEPQTKPRLIGEGTIGDK